MQSGGKFFKITYDYRREGLKFNEISCDYRRDCLTIDETTGMYDYRQEGAYFLKLLQALFWDFERGRAQVLIFTIQIF